VIQRDKKSSLYVATSQALQFFKVGELDKASVSLSKTWIELLRNPTHFTHWESIWSFERVSMRVNNEYGLSPEACQAIDSAASFFDKTLTSPYFTFIYLLALNQKLSDGCKAVDAVEIANCLGQSAYNFAPLVVFVLRTTVRENREDLLRAWLISLPVGSRPKMAERLYWVSEAYRRPTNQQQFDWVNRLVEELLRGLP
jgi:hypothetical protein